MNRTLMILLLFLAFCAPLFAETWTFKTPPTAVKTVPVDADWRKFDALELDFRLMEQSNPTSTLVCTFFFQTKQDLWLESRQELAIGDKKQTIRLRLDDLSPDWRVGNTRRAFDGDTLRWVRSWGIKVFSPDAHTGKIELSDLRLIPAKERSIEVSDIMLPELPAAGNVNPVRFRLIGFRGNPFSSSDISCKLIWKEEGKEKSAPFYFRQEFQTFKHPGAGEILTNAFERPFWQADWMPAGEGKYHLRVELQTSGSRITGKLGQVTVGSARASAEAVEASKAAPAFATMTNSSPRMLEFKNGKWTDATTLSSNCGYWVAPLDWTGKWGRYTGSGEFEQLTAWQIEQELRRCPTNISRPMLLFNDDELETFSKFNWLDNPLNAVNGGNLKRAGDIFTDDNSRRIVLDRARYLCARYSRYPGAAGLLIRMKRIEPAALAWVNAIATKLNEEFPGIPIFCDNPELLERWRSSPLEPDGRWTADRRIARGTIVHMQENGKTLSIEGRYPGSSAVICKRMQHFAGAEVLACDITTPPVSNNGFKAMCCLRTDPDTLFQSKLVELRNDDCNHVHFNLDDPAFWTCPRNPARRLTDDQLLNITELELRFFCDEPEDGRIEVRNFALLWPYKTDYEKRALAISGLKGNAGQVGQYEKLEFEFQLNRTFNNPYNPHEIDVAIELTDPDNKQLHHPGFFYEPWSLDMKDGVETAVRQPDRPSWRVRFTPSKPGKYEWKLIAKSGDEQAAVTTGSFVCVSNPSPGFVRTSKPDPKCFEFSDGSFFYPIGYNLRSPSDRRTGAQMRGSTENADWADAQGTRAYEKWFRLMRENDINLTRVWMCPWWCGLEWAPEYEGYHGIGYYNQANAARLDRIMELAEKEKVYVCLETVNHGGLSTMTDADWQDNPYNKDMHPGGYVSRATQFFTDPRCIESHRNKMRYVVARWGYSTAIAWYGILTEAEWTEAYGAGGKTRNTFLDWIAATGGYIRDTDAQPHLVSAHFSNPGNGLDMWRRDNVDVVHNNAYTFFTEFWERDQFAESQGVADVIYVFGKVYEPYSREKPLMIGEWGGDANGNRKQQLVAELHTGLWAMTMTRTAGIGGYWWWNLVDADNLYDRFKSIAVFMKGEDRRGKNYKSERAKLTYPSIGSADDLSVRAGLVLYSRNELFAYVYSCAINRHKYSLVAKGADDKSLPESGNGFLAVPHDFQNGDYTVEYWDTFAGSVINTAEVTVSAESRRIPLISHRVDLAIKVKPAKLNCGAFH